MMIPQIKSTLVSIVTIMLGGPLMGAYFAWQTGELHNFSQLGLSLEHGLFGGVMMAIGWIFLRSPFAGRITELIGSAKSTEPGGTVTQTEAKITITEPPPETHTEKHP